MRKGCFAVSIIGLCLVGLSCSTEQPTSPIHEQSMTRLLPDQPRPTTGHNPRVIPPHANPGGMSYSEWSVEWWRWLWSAPVDVNPGLDETGEFVDVGQSGHVWFIAPNYGGVSERYATIPPGKMLFIDVAADFEATLLGAGETEEELRAVAAYVIDSIESVNLVVDGTPLQDIEAYRVASPLFEFTLPEDNVIEFFGYDAPAGTYYPAVSDGYFAMLAPLPVGEHTLYIETYFGDPLNFESIVTLHLTVASH